MTTATPTALRPVDAPRAPAPATTGAPLGPLDVAGLARKVLATAAGDNRTRQSARRLPRLDADAPQQTLLALMHSAQRDVGEGIATVQVLHGRVIVSDDDQRSLLSAGEQRRLPRRAQRLEASDDAVLLLTGRG